MEIEVDVITGRGDNVLAQTLALTQLVDYVAYYTAVANGVDPALRRLPPRFKRAGRILPSSKRVDSRDKR